jgi:hypothetical protein
MARKIVAVILAGLVGALVNTAFVAVLMELEGLGAAAALELALKPGRYAVAIAVAAVLPFAARLSGPRAWAASLLALTLAPSLLTLLWLRPDAPAVWVLAANLVYAAAATGTYALLVRRGR